MANLERNEKQDIGAQKSSNPELNLVDLMKSGPGGTGGGGKKDLLDDQCRKGEVIEGQMGGKEGQENKWGGGGEKAPQKEIYKDTQKGGEKGTDKHVGPKKDGGKQHEAPHLKPDVKPGAIKFLDFTNPYI